MLEIKLNEVMPAGSRVMAGSIEIEVPSGKHLRIETSPNGEELLDMEVPEGEGPWTVNLSVTVTECTVGG